jgi:hypothetical protein
MKRLAIGLGLPAVVLAMLLVVLGSVSEVRPAQANHIPYAVGDVFAGVGAGSIKHFNSSGTLLETLDTGTTCNEQLGMAFDAPGNLYATSSFGCAGTVVKFNNQGGLIGPFGSGYNANPESIAIDAAGKVYVGQPDGTADILCFNPAGTPCTPNASFDVAVQNRGSDWIDLAADQCTMFYTSEGSSVKRFDVCTNTQLPDFATGLTGPCYALRIRTNGEVMVTCTSQTYRLNANGSVNTTYPIPGASLLFAMNLDPDGANFWTGDYFSGDIFKVNIATGAGTAAPVFNANKTTFLSGLAVFGELRAAQPVNPVIKKDPPLANLWLCQPVPRCVDATNGIGERDFNVELNSPITSLSPKGEAQTIGSFEFEVRYDSKFVSVEVVAGPLFDRRDATCSTIPTQNAVQFACNIKGKNGEPIVGPGTLAIVKVTPTADVYSMLIPNQGNGIATQLINQGCQLSDLQGHPIKTAICGDAELTIRYLEGDVNADCEVNVQDQQQIAFRWGSHLGSLLYNSRFDLEPAAPKKGDGDIDAKDLQVVWGRHNTIEADTCINPHPGQDPVDPKAIPTKQPTPTPPPGT